MKPHQGSEDDGYHRSRGGFKKTREELHEEFLGYRAYCETFLQHKRRYPKWLVRNQGRTVSCRCGCGESWNDDITEHNLVASFFKLGTFLKTAWSLYIAFRHLHTVLWLAGSRAAELLHWRNVSVSVRNTAPFTERPRILWCWVMFMTYFWIAPLLVPFWAITRFGGALIMALHLVAWAVMWSVLAVIFALYLVVLLPFAASLVLGIAAGYYMGERWWLTILCVAVGASSQYLLERHKERKRRTEMGMILVAMDEILLHAEPESRASQVIPCKPVQEGKEETVRIP